MAKIKIKWEEFGGRDIFDFKKIAVGKDYFQYQEDFSEDEAAEFLNFQQNRKIPNQTKILEIKIIDSYKRE